MDYKFTFEDGSEAIAHHGVKGMKWGVRNAETLAKYGLLNAKAAVGGGGGIALDEESDFDARDYGFEDNSEESREAALGEAGLNSKMSRETALAKVQADYKKLNQQYPLKNAEAIERRRKSMEMDLKLANSLPSEKETSKSSKKLNGVTDKIGKTVEAKKAADEAKKLISQKHKKFVKIGDLRINLGETPSFNVSDVVAHEVNRVLGKNRKSNDGTVSKAIGNVKDEASVAYVKTKVNKRKNANGPMPTATGRISDAVYAVKAGRK